MSLCYLCLLLLSSTRCKIPETDFLLAAAAGDNTFRIHCSIDLVAQAAFYANPNTMTNTSSDLETVDVLWITWVNCSFRMKAISPQPPKLGSDTWHNIIYTSQNNFKSSSRTRNWLKLQHAAILSCWHHLCMLRLSKIVILMISHTNFWWFRKQILNFLMI